MTTRPPRTYPYEIVESPSGDIIHKGDYTTHYEAFLGWLDSEFIHRSHPVTYRLTKRAHVYSMTLDNQPLAMIVRRVK